jgi:hypothetical protein
MRNHLVLVAGLLLISCFPIEAQIPAAPVVLAKTSLGLPTILFQASRVPSSTQLPERPLPHPALLLAAAYKPEPSLQSRLPIDEFRTPLVAESRFPVAHLWRGLKLNVFESTFHSHSWQRGSPTSGVGFEDLRPRSSDQAAVGSSLASSGLSLSYSFGRDGATKKSVQILRCLTWVVGNGRGCPL